MTEEDVTKTILNWLIHNEWVIVCFDFPQSGTGVFLHPNAPNLEKNKGTINPDIVAVKGTVSLFFENKNRFFYQDFEKQNKLITEDRYSLAINRLLENYSVSRIYYGIGFPSICWGKNSMNAANLVDFVIGVGTDRSIHVLHNPKNIEF